LHSKLINAGCLAVALCAAGAVPAQAQMTWMDRAFVNVNFGAQEASRSLDAGSEFSIYNEQGTLATTQPIDGGALFDIGGGYKVWKNLAVGLSFTRVKSDADIAIAASVPDPNFFDRVRPLTATSSNAEHSEQAIHIQGTWVMPVTDKFDAAFSFGPTIFNVKQDVATAITVNEPGPSLGSVTMTQEKKTAVGVNFGADLNYFFMPKIGAGLLVRYAWGSTDLDAATESLTLGGFQIGAGVRLRF
jgi:Outer membrane protein beta-barrel domain